jgi:hypothetical protein
MVNFKEKFFLSVSRNGEKVQKGQNHPEDFADINLVEWRARKRRTTMLPNGSISRVLYSGRARTHTTEGLLHASHC